MELCPAAPGDVDDVFAIYEACTAALLARGIRQWDPQYPDRAVARDAADRGELFLLVAGDRRLGSVILNRVQAPEYAAIPWQYREPAMVIHTLVIDPAQQGAGLGRTAVVACEAFGRDRGFASVRLDAYPGNPAAIALYARLGYEYRGDVEFSFKPPGHQRYAVYEKPLT
jgi:ribosomal protein S18 acetylase RimI-like enzyme